MNNKMIMTIIGATVGILMIGAVLSPVLSEAMETEKTFYNSGFSNMVELGAEAQDISWDISTGILTYNGTNIPLAPSALSSMYPSIIATDTFCFRIGYANSSYFMHSTNNGQLVTLTDSSSVFSAHIEDGTINLTRGAVTQTIPYNQGYVISLEGLYTMKSTSKEVYVHSDTEIFATGITSLDGTWYRSIHIEGPLDNLTVTPLGVDATVSNVAVSKTAVEGYVDLYSLASIEFDVTTSNGTTHCRFTYFIVPSEITAEKEHHLNTDAILVLGAIIPVVLVSLVATMAISRRN